MTRRRLDFYIKYFHKLTFEIEKEFADIYKYEERLKYFKEVFQPKVLKLRKKFWLEFSKNKKLKKAYHKYMKETHDYIFFVNSGVSAPDQRKFDGGGFIPFTAYWYQVVIWELYNNFTIGYWKSRDIGLSFAINSGETMELVLDGGSEVFYLSRVQDDVDKSRDRTNSNMGRVRQIAESHPLYTLDDFYQNVFLTLYSSKKTGILGFSTSANPGRSKRARRALVDESGAVRNLDAIKQSILMSAKNVTFAGTLLAGKDAGFRKVIKEGYRINPREIWEDFSKKYKNFGNDYRRAWDLVIKNLKKKIPQGKAISFTNTYEDHPLKAGNCDYLEIEKNRLLNDEVMISLELLADLNAGSPDRSFYSLTKEHHDKIEVTDFSGYNVIMGFDPGSHGTAAMVPIIIDHYGFYYILPAEIFHKGSMIEWIDKLIMKYGRFVIYAEESVKAYSKAGAGWLSVLRARDIKTIIVSNRHPEDQLLVVNEIFRRKILDENGNEKYKVIMAKENEWWSMSYISGMKYEDIEQRKMSHSAEAMIAPIFEMNKDVLDGVKKGVKYG